MAMVDFVKQKYLLFIIAIKKMDRKWTGSGLEVFGSGMLEIYEL